jgi:hypothetical protein
MIQLWFNTAIPWITKPSVEWVKWTQVKNFTQEQKDGIKQQIKNPNIKKVTLSPTAPRLASTEMVWITKPRRADEAYIRNLTIELLDSSMQWTWVSAVFDKYKDTLSEDWIKTANFMALDILNGSGSEEIVNAYKKQWLSVEAINTILEINELQKQTYQWIWNIWGGVWEITDEKWDSMWIWKIAWATAAIAVPSAILISWLAGATLKKLWKVTYWLALTNPKDTARLIKDNLVEIKELKNDISRIKEVLRVTKDPTEIGLLKNQISKIEESIMLAKDTAPESITEIWLRTKWTVWWLKKIWTTIEASAKDIAKRFIEPWLQKATDYLWKIKLSDIFSDVETKIANLAKSKWQPYADSVMEAFNDIKNAAVGSKKELTHLEANAIKSGLYDLMWAKEKAWKIVTNVASKAKALLASAFVWKITWDIKKVDPTWKILKEYKSYWTRKMAGAMAEWIIREPWIWNALWTTSAIIKTVAAPVTTLVGKWMYKLWKWLEYISWIPAVKKWIKLALKVIKSPVVKAWAKVWWKALSVLAILWAINEFMPSNVSASEWWPKQTWKQQFENILKQSSQPKLQWQTLTPWKRDIVNPNAQIVKKWTNVLSQWPNAAPMTAMLLNPSLWLVDLGLDVASWTETKIRKFINSFSKLPKEDQDNIVNHISTLVPKK